MKKITLLGALMLLTSISFSQTLRYEIKAMGIKAGILEVTRKIVNGLEQYHIETHSSVNFVFGKVVVDHSTTCSYKDGVLQNSYVRNEKNGEIEYYSSITYDGKTYQIKNEKGNKTFTSPINFSIPLIFFNEPAGKSEVFSERFGQNVPIKKVGDHAYLIKMPDGDEFTYYYENGKIVKSDLPSPVGKAHFYLQQ